MKNLNLLIQQIKFFLQDCYGISRLRLRFEGSCLKQEETSPFIQDNILNLFIVCELDAWSRDLHTDFTLKDSLF